MWAWATKAWLEHTVPEEKVVVYDAINTALEPNILRGLNGGEDMFSE